MISKPLITIILIALSLFAVKPYFDTLAKTKCVEIDENIDESELEEIIKECEEKVEDLKNQGESLSREIEYANSQINLTELKIQNSLKKLSEKENEILKLAGDIEDLRMRIDKLGDSIEYQQNVLRERMRSRYMSIETSPLVVIFGSDTFNTIIQKTEYLKIMELQDHKLLKQMNETKTAYGVQKNLFEDKKEKEEQLKVQIQTEKNNLETYRSQLSDLREQKQKLLADTQNDEQKYQSLLEDARRELRQIQGAASVVIREGNAVDVEKGEIIGTMGSSGNSTGPHLHFSIYRYSVEDFMDLDSWEWYYSNYINPLDKLKSKTVYWDTGCWVDPSGSNKSGKGSWEWPMSDIRITQNYGSNTCYNWMYGGKPHPALDLVGMSNISVRAVKDGEAYFCRNCLGDGGNGVFIFHDDDYMTVYWHLK